MKLLICEFSPLAIVLQETMLGNNKPPCPRLYNCVASEHDMVRGNNGGCAIYTRYDVPYTTIKLQTPLQAIAVKIQLTRKYTICSLYIPPNNPFTSADLNNLIRQLPAPFLILGDFNARHPSWGDIVANARGNLLSSFVEDEDICVLNSGQPTHFHIQTGTLSAIDLSICSSDCVVDFSWQVNDDLHGSDHFPIILSIENSIPSPRSPRWRLDRANWSLFRDLCTIEGTVEDLPSVDDAIEALSDIFHRAGTIAIPRTTGKFNRKPVLWWNEECRVSHRAMKAAFTRYKNHGCDYYKIAYK